MQGSGRASSLPLRRCRCRRCLLASLQRCTLLPLCPTGAAGFIGSRIVARLLAAGHTVHATRRAAGDDAPTIAALQVCWRDGPNLCGGATAAAGRRAWRLILRYLPAGLKGTACSQYCCRPSIRLPYCPPFLSRLQELPGAAERLRWFEANLVREGSFDAAVAGCRCDAAAGAPERLCASWIKLPAKQLHGWCCL